MENIENNRSDNFQINITADLKSTISVEQAWHYQIIPKNVDTDTAIFYTTSRNKSIYKQELEQYKVSLGVKTFNALLYKLIELGKETHIQELEKLIKKD